MSHKCPLVQVSPGVGAGARRNLSPPAFSASRPVKACLAPFLTDAGCRFVLRIPKSLHAGAARSALTRAAERRQSRAHAREVGHPHTRLLPRAYNDKYS